MPTFASQSKQLSLEQFHSVKEALSSAVRTALRDAAPPQEVLLVPAVRPRPLRVACSPRRCQRPCSGKDWEASLQCWWRSALRLAGGRGGRRC